MANIALMTTCKQRLENYNNEVMEAIESIASQVDKVYLVLSREEFNDKIPKLNLPMNVIVQICVKNIYSFKKFMPLLTRRSDFNDNDNIFLVDDDWRYHPDYVKYMLDFMGNAEVASLGCGGCIGAFTVFKDKCIDEEFFKYWTHELIDTRIDDIYMTNYFKFKNRKAHYYDKCVDELVRTVSDPLIPISANNPNNEVYPKTFRFASQYRPWQTTTNSK